MDDTEDFEDDDDLEEVNSLKISRRNPNDVGDLVLKLPSFATGNDALRKYAWPSQIAGASIWMSLPLDLDLLRN